jgi:RNA polymerase sigma-70 factor (ECF subfamily)
MTSPNSTVALASAEEVPQVRCDSLDLKTTRERELMQRICAGGTDLFYELIRPYERAVFLAASSILGNDADAEDVAQEAILKAFKNLRGFRQESKFSTWLIQIAINEAKMKLRKNRRHLYESIDDTQTTDEGDYIPTDFADWREIPSEALEQSELRDALNNALKLLPEKYRIALILRDVQQMSIAETAMILGLSEENVKTRTSRARLRMRDLLAPGAGGSWAKKSASGARSVSENQFELNDQSSFVSLARKR